ncbi:MAG: DNA polymerase III subunit gamma/tau [bacterium]
MSYQVLARKWRPHKFSEMVGQEHVKQALVNGLNNDRLHHAFLFTGTRGVGKTTIARILAKSLNCEQGVSAEPCGECSSCIAVDEGRFVDLIEVDAASRTKVDDTRELLDNVQYMPTSGRYKVYLVDEVHMLSTSSFNALLKTLEEPPSHVKFLFATTDPQKVPVTVLSRCLQFNLRRLTETEIYDQLMKILTAEKVEYDEPAIRELARAGDGSMRDALSLMDQAIGFGGGEVREQQVRQMLGSVDRDVIYHISDHIVAKDTKGLLELSQEIYNAALPPDRVLEAMAELFYVLSVEQQVNGAPVPSHLNPEKIQQYAQQFSATDLQLLYEIATRCRQDLHLAPSPRIGLDMALLRMMAFVPVDLTHNHQVIGESVQRSTQATNQPASTQTKATSNDIQQPSQVRRSVPVSNNQQHNSPQAIPKGPDDKKWASLFAQLGLRGPSAELGKHCVWGEQDEQQLTLYLDPTMVVVLSPPAKKGLQVAVKKHLGLELEIKVKTQQVRTIAQDQQQQAQNRALTEQELVKNDPVAQQLQSTFDAKLQQKTVKLTEVNND